jgi:CDP-glucose 4,6-dehydratase
VGKPISAVEDMALNAEFWQKRTVLVTGHTGFKGSWLLLMLEHLGARVTGFALSPPTAPAMFDKINGERRCSHNVGDIRDAAAIADAIITAQPEIVLHLAAQPLVRASYADPLANYATNVIGTANVLEACRLAPSVKAVVVVTTDKCYANDGRSAGYVEDDKLGGFDPYSNSKACAELVTAAYRDSFLADKDIGVASARAGNVMGGGDYAQDRLIPDAIRAFEKNRAVEIRNPHAVRPWQHVLEPLYGYLQLAERLYADRSFAQGWNFGPSAGDMAEVQTVIATLMRHLGIEQRLTAQPGDHPHEAAILTLDSSLAAEKLNWTPALDLDQALALTAAWYRFAQDNDDVSAFTIKQIRSFLAIKSNG